MNSLKPQKQTVYCIPGLSASKSIFEYLPHSDSIEYVLLDQKFPLTGESFDSYIERWSKEIKIENAIVIGVSFGGIIAQELVKHKAISKIILISSVRSPRDYSLMMKVFKSIRIYKLLLTRILKKLYKIEQNPKTEHQRKMSAVLKKYLPYRDPYYVKWSAEKIINWIPSEVSIPIVQIHGTKDEIFPFDKTKNAISIKDGTHAMIVTKRKWFEENLLNYLID